MNNIMFGTFLFFKTTNNLGKDETRELG